MAKKHIAALVSAIKADGCPRVMDASYSASMACMGDLMTIGWSFYHKKREGKEFDTYWVYNGPNMIQVGDDVLKKGDETPHVLVG